MSAVKKWISNIRLGRQRDCNDVESRRHLDLKRSNAKVFKKHDTNLDCLDRLEVLEHRLSAGKGNLVAYTKEPTLLATFSRNYSFEAGASVEDFGIELQRHSNRLHKTQREPRRSEAERVNNWLAEESSTIPICRLLSFASDQPERRHSSEALDSVKKSKSELYDHSNLIQKKHKKQNWSPSLGHAVPRTQFDSDEADRKLRNLRTRAESAQHLPVEPTKEASKESSSHHNTDDRHSFVSNPSYPIPALESLVSTKSSPHRQQSSIETNPHEQVKDAANPCSSAAQPAKAPRNHRQWGFSRNLSHKDSWGRVDKIIHELRDRYRNQLHDQEWDHIVEFFSTDYSPAVSNVSVNSAGSTPSNEEVVFQGRGKGKERQLAEQSSSSQCGPVLPKDVRKGKEGKEDAQTQQRDIVVETKLRTSDEQAPGLTLASLDDLAAEVELLLNHHQEEADRIKAVELEVACRREQEEAEHLAAEQAQQRLLKECVACAESKRPLEFPLRPPTALCDHTSNTCDECLKAWLASEFDTKGYNGLKCPECPQTLEHNDIKAVASVETFAAYDKLITRTALGAFHDFAWCLGENCSSGQLNINDYNYMHCASCGYKQCLKHRVPWHKGETCEQYEYRTSGQQARDEEKATEKMIDTISKKCPGKKCGWRIQKIAGCDHMTCKICKHQFCWQCLASHLEIQRVGNTAHEKTCKFHSNNLGASYPLEGH